MVTITASPTRGHCSQCGKVWTLDTKQGVCRWCGKEAVFQLATKPRQLKSSRRLPRPRRPAIGQGYDQLTEPYLTYYNVACRYAHKAMPDDQEDLLHDIMIHLDSVARRKPLSVPAMYRIAGHIKDHYWYSHYKVSNGLDCQHCSKAQRHKCRKDYLYPECPKAIALESLNKPIIDSEGNLTELGELIADDKALDIPQWCEVNEQLLHSPNRALAIAGKLQDREALTGAERKYLAKLRKARQKSLF